MLIFQSLVVLFKWKCHFVLVSDTKFHSRPPYWKNGRW